MYFGEIVSFVKSLLRLKRLQKVEPKLQQPTVTVHVTSVPEKFKYDVDSFEPYPKPRAFSYIVLHHSATKDGYLSDYEAIDRYHREVKGWNKIGYHFLVEYIEKELRCRVGRYLDEVGAHAQGFNSNGIGICLVGNYSKIPPAKEQLDALRYLCIKLMTWFRIGISNVIGHRETFVLLNRPVQKDCPGNAFDLDAFRKSLGG